MRFIEALDDWTRGRLTQAEAALLLGNANAAFAATLSVTRPAAWTGY